MLCAFRQQLVRWLLKSLACSALEVHVNVGFDRACQVSYRALCWGIVLQCSRKRGDAVPLLMDSTLHGGKVLGKCKAGRPCVMLQPMRFRGLATHPERADFWAIARCTLHDDVHYGPFWQ